MKTEKYKTPNFSILTSHYYCLFSLFFLLCSLLSTAQNYEWSWAKSGGGNLKMVSESSGATDNNFHFEHIKDIATDEDNNYYFLGKIAHGDSHVEGNEVTTFGNAIQGSNIIITSFTCDGTYRWSRVIGGGGGSLARNGYKLVLDNNGGIYVSVRYVAVEVAGDNNQPPVCFGEDNCLPYLTGNNQEEQEGYKNMFLLKYDTEFGNLMWRKDYQGNVSYNNGQGFITDVQIDGNNVLHTIIGLQDGIHLDGALTVELEEGEQIKYYLVKFDSTNGNLIGTPLLLPLVFPEGYLNSIADNTSFRYDENLNRYYLVSFRDNSSSPAPSFNGVTFSLSSNGSYGFVLSFNPDNFNDWWYKEITGASLRWITGIEIDSNSDIYIGGNIAVSQNSSTFFGTHLIGEHPVTTSYSGRRPFILKMNSNGEVQWSKIPSGYINPAAATGISYAYDVAINGNEVALATHGWSFIWDNFSINRPEGHLHDPTLLRFNKQTGEVIGLHDIYGSGGNHRLTAVTADQDGNYVVGGAMRYSLFTDNPNGIPTLYNTGSGGAYTDFFMARLAATPCGTPVASNNNFEKQALKLYPNPTSGLVYIEAQNLQGYEVYNLLGQRLLSGNNEVIDLQDLSKGTYIVKVRTQSGEVMTSKVMKQ